MDSGEERWDLLWLGVVLWIVMESPHVDHDDCILGDEVSFIPVVLNNVMVLT